MRSHSRKSRFAGTHAVQRLMFLFIALALVGAALVWPVWRIARAADGDLDPTFGTGGKVQVDFGSGDFLNDMVLQPDGKIVSAGQSGFSTSDFALARLNADGTLDNTFSQDGRQTTNFNGLDAALAVALQPDGKIVAGGSTQTRANDGRRDFALARYNPDGSLDISFDGDGKVVTDFNGFDDQINDLYIQPDGKIVVAGGATFSRNSRLDTDVALARYNPDGSLDTSFGASAPAMGNSFEVQPNAPTITAVGGKVTIDNEGRNQSALDIRSFVPLHFGSPRVFLGINTDNGPIQIWRLTEDAEFDTEYGGGDGIATADFGEDCRLNAAALLPDGDQIAGGSCGDKLALARFNADGMLDVTFGMGGKLTKSLPGVSRYEAGDILPLPDKTILTCGIANDARSAEKNDFTCSRQNPDGTDTNFCGTGTCKYDISGNTDNASALLQQPDGKVIIGGTVLDFTGAPNQNMAFARVEFSTTIPTGPADVSVSLTAAPANVQPGGQITYTVSVTNNDNVDTALGVEGRVQIPTGTTFVSCTQNGLTCSSRMPGDFGTPGAFSQPDIPPGATRSQTIVVTVNAGVPTGTVISNTAHVTATNDENPNNNQTPEVNVTVGAQPTPSANLVVTKRIIAASALPGSDVFYEIEVTNRGPDSADAVVITDNLPAQLALSFCDVAPLRPTTCDIANNSVRVTSGILRKDESINILLVASIRSSVAGGTQVVNTATASANTHDPEANNSSSASFVVESPPPPPTPPPPPSNCPPISFDPTPLSDGRVNAGYSTQTRRVTGSSIPYQIEVSGLPPGIRAAKSTDGDSITFFGTPREAGTFTVTLTATDRFGCRGTTNYVVKIDPPQPPTISGFTPEFGPAGIEVEIRGANLGNATSVTINGTPAAIANNGANVTFIVVPHNFMDGPITITTSGGSATSATPFRFSSVPPPVPVPSPNPCQEITLDPILVTEAQTGQGYPTQRIRAQGGTAPYTIFIEEGRTPPGIGLASDAQVNDAVTLEATDSVAPLQVGVYTFRLTATDANGCIGKRTYTIEVYGDRGPLSISTTSAPAGALVAISGRNLLSPPRGGNASANSTSFAPLALGSLIESFANNAAVDAGETVVRFNGTVAEILYISDTAILTKVPEGATSGPLTISNGGGTVTAVSNFTVTTPSPSTLQFSSSAQSVTESCGSVPVTVTRTGNTSAPTSVDYVTASGTASDRADYTKAFGTLLFAAGETSKTLNLLVTEDVGVEGAETIIVTLNNIPAGTGLGNPSNFTLTIEDDDAAPTGANPIDDAQIFVCQHYHDFLNREADAPGLAFWTNQITDCEQRPEAERQACREVRRINVSAAFFLSIEFQETGYFVYRTHQAAFDTGAGLKLNTFLADAQKIGRGVVVGQGEWQAQLEANRQAFVNEFVERPEFIEQYPMTMTPAQFVLALNANTGGSLSASERGTLINDLMTGAKTRAAVLRAVTEDTDFNRREFTPAFVYMQYVGYLRRNPAEAPDTNFDGYNFWLSKLNQFGGNFIAAEMVKAFISSIEYRRRFSQ